MQQGKVNVGDAFKADKVRVCMYLHIRSLNFHEDFHLGRSHLVQFGAAKGERFLVATLPYLTHGAQTAWPTSTDELRDSV